MLFSRHYFKYISLMTNRYIFNPVINRLPMLKSPPPARNGRVLTGDSFRCIFVNEKFCILIKMKLKFPPQGPICNNPSRFRKWAGTEYATSHCLNQYRPDSLAHICQTRGRCVNYAVESKLVDSSFKKTMESHELRMNSMSENYEIPVIFAKS